MRTSKCTAIFVIGGLVFALGSTASPGEASSATQGSVASAAVPAPFGKLRDLLDRVKKDASKSKDRVDAGLTADCKASVLVMLDDIQAEINTLFDPSTDPSLYPPTAGDVLSDFQPETLSELAADTDWLASAAFVEGSQPNASHYLIGSYVLTIEVWLDDYRQAVIDA